MRIVRIELRRTSVLLVAAVLAVLLVGLLSWGPSAKNSTAWTRQWSTLAEWVRYMLLFAWPLAMGAGALLGLRDRRSGVAELFGTTPRPPAQRVLRTLVALAVALGASYLVVAAAGAARVPSATGYFHWRWLPVLLVGLLALVAAAWLGFGLGRLAPSPLTPPVLAVVGLVVMVQGEGPTGPELFRWTMLRPSVPSPDTVYASVTGAVTAAQALWFAGLALAGLLLAALRRWWWVALLPVLAAGAVALPALPTAPGAVVAVDPVAADLVCSPELCLTRAHEHERAALAGPAREALRLLAALPSPPTQVRESADPVRLAGRAPESADVVWLHLDEMTYFRSGPVSAERVTAFLVAGAGTRTCYGGHVPDSVSREIAARAVAAAWVTGRLEPLPIHRAWVGEETDVLARSAWDALRALPPAEQSARVEAMRQVQARCSGDPLEALAGVSP